jgi:hypothetical protein
MVFLVVEVRSDAVEGDGLGSGSVKPPDRPVGGL